MFLWLITVVTFGIFLKVVYDCGEENVAKLVELQKSQSKQAEAISNLCLKTKKACDQLQEQQLELQKAISNLCLQMQKKCDLLQDVQLELVDELSDIRSKMAIKDRDNLKLQKKVEELNNDRKRIVNENGTVVVCETFAPRTVNIGFSLFGRVFSLTN